MFIFQFGEGGQQPRDINDWHAALGGILAVRRAEQALEDLLHGLADIQVQPNVAFRLSLSEQLCRDLVRLLALSGAVQGHGIQRLEFKRDIDIVRPVEMRAEPLKRRKRLSMPPEGDMHASQRQIASFVARMWRIKVKHHLFGPVVGRSQVAVR